MKPASRFDAPFWAVLLSGVVLVGSFACIGFALAAEDASHVETDVMTTDDAPGGPVLRPELLTASAD
jgi:hypothetical protein